MTPRIDARLSAWRRQRLAALWAEGGARLAAAAGAVLLAAAVADRLLGLPLALRWGLFAAGAAAAAAGAAAWLVRPLRLLEAGAVLDAAARRWPEARGLLRSAWELARAPLTPATSAALAERHVAEAERAAAALPVERLFPVALGPGLKRRLAGLAGLWAVGLPFVGPAGVRRVAAPWLERPLEAELEVRPGDARLSWGASAEVSARWKESAPGGPLGLEVRAPGGAWTRAPWDGEPERVWRSEGLSAPLEYRLSSRDRRTRAYRLEPIPFPRFAKLSARVHRPGGEAEEVSLEGASELAALRGSWVALRGEAERALDAARLEVSSLGGPVPMRRQGGNVWEGGFPLRQDGTLRVVAEAEGLREPDPPVLRLRALEDRPPEAVILSPAFAVETSPRERLPVAYEARDDFGLSALALVYRVDGDAGKNPASAASGRRQEAAGPERVIPLAAPARGATAQLGEHPWDLSAFPPGTRLEFRLRAADNARPEPQVSYSAPGLVVLSDFEAQHAAAERRWLGSEAQLGALAEEERRMREALAAAQDRPERAAGLDAQERALSQSWERAARSMGELAEGLERDPYANPGMTETVQALAEALEATRREDLAAARRARTAGDLPAAERLHAELERKARRAGELLAGGREIQAMQDLWAETQRMDQAGRELAGALDKLAKGGAPGAEEKRRLDAALKELDRQMEALHKTIASLPKAEEGSPAERRRKVYAVPLGEARETMDALAAAMARGDYAEAARLARELSSRLEAVRRAVSRAAQDLAESADQSPARRLSELEEAWKEAVAAQERALESVAAVEEERLAQRTKAQEALLERLTAEQRAAVREGERLASWMPPGALPDMRAALAELEAKALREAPARMERAAGRLDAQAAALSPQGSEPPQAARELAELARVQLGILERLKEGGRNQPMTEEQLSASLAAEAVQRQASKKAEGLQPLIEGLERDYGLDLGEAQRPLGEARGAQSSAEAALSRRDTAAARPEQARALELLRKGQQAVGESKERSQSAQQGASQPFSQRRGTARPMGRGGRTGADTGLVPLPGASDYQPPREIRGEVEKSLQERRPASFDQAVDEYLKRLSQ